MTAWELYSFSRDTSTMMPVMATTGTMISVTNTVMIPREPRLLALMYFFFVPFSSDFLSSCQISCPSSQIS